jgi:hypothetical protein
MARETNTIEMVKELKIMFAQKLICSWIGAFGLAAGAFCQTYAPILVDHTIDARCNERSGCYTFALTINNAGTIAGYYYYYASGQVTRGFVRDADGTITTFEVAGSSTTQVLSINDEGAIAGSYASTTEHRFWGYIRHPEGNFTTFEVPGSTGTFPQSINAGGTIAGYYVDSTKMAHGFVRHADGTLISFDPPGRIGTGSIEANRVLSINVEGTIVGYYLDADDSSHGFVRQPWGTIISFDPPGSRSTYPSGINDGGTISGSWGRGRSWGFVRDPDGKFTSFDPDTETYAHSINNEGTTTGYFTDVDGDKFDPYMRSPEGTIVPFRVPFCALFQHLSINDKGVITGVCYAQLYFSFVRFP